MAKEIEITDELRKTIAEKNAEALKAEGLNPDRVEKWEDGCRTAGRDDSFEWWYFDAELDDGSAIVTTFSNKPNTKPEGPLEPTVLLILRSPEGERRTEVYKGEPDEFIASRDSCDVKIGPSHVKGDLDRYEMHVEVNGITADLTMTRRAPSWRPGAAITYLDPEKTRYFAWVVPVPYGTLEGTLQVDGSEPKPVKGTFYHDHNWGNFMLYRMLDHWYWGRAHVGEFSLIFVQMVTAGLFGFGAVKLPTIYLAREDEIITDDGWPMHLKTDEFVKGPGGRSYPTRIDIQWHAEEGDMDIRIRNPRLIESLDENKDFAWWARPLVHIVMNPYYYDFTADIELELDLKGIRVKEKGRVLYEQMLFHKKQR